MNNLHHSVSYPATYTPAPCRQGGGISSEFDFTLLVGPFASIFSTMSICSCGVCYERNDRSRAYQWRIHWSRCLVVADSVEISIRRRHLQYLATAYEA